MEKVKVIDAIMGSGKTSYAIQLMQEAPSNQKFIYVTPFLDEVTRIKETVTNRNFKEPIASNGLGTKLKSFKDLIANGEDVATTHALFSLADDEVMDLLQWNNYTLIIDEVMEVFSIINSLRKDDIPVLKKSGLIEIKDDGQVVWIAEKTSDTQYNEVKRYALAGNLYNVRDIAFVWNFPAKVFDKFDEVYIMTYLFEIRYDKFRKFE